MEKKLNRAVSVSKGNAESKKNQGYYIFPYRELHSFNRESRICEELIIPDCNENLIVLIVGNNFLLSYHV